SGLIIHWSKVQILAGPPRLFLQPHQLLQDSGTTGVCRELTHDGTIPNAQILHHSSKHIGGGDVAAGARPGAADSGGNESIDHSIHQSSDSRNQAAVHDGEERGSLGSENAER